MRAGRGNRRLAHPREQVLAAALAMISEQGLAALTMAGLGARLGTSGGHLLYYFGTKNKLLLETLRWSEDSYTVRREEIVHGTADLREGFVAFADLYLPEHGADPRWQLWLELWARAPYDEALARGQWELDTPWREGLARLLDRCLRDAHPDRVRSWIDRTLAMLDGFSLAVATGAPVERAHVLDLLAAHADELAAS